MNTNAYLQENIHSVENMNIVNTLSLLIFFLRKWFLDGDLDVSMIGTKITLTVGKGPSALSFDLFESKAAERKIEMQDVLFRLANFSTKLQNDLSTANKSIENLRAQKSAAGAAPFMDLGPKKSNPAKSKTTKAGMSVVNPTSKKRKAATGVVFD